MLTDVFGVRRKDGWWIVASDWWMKAERVGVCLWMGEG